MTRDANYSHEHAGLSELSGPQVREATKENMTSLRLAAALVWLPVVLLGLLIGLVGLLAAGVASVGLVATAAVGLPSWRPSSQPRQRSQQHSHFGAMDGSGHRY